MVVIIQLFYSMDKYLFAKTKVLYSVHETHVYKVA